MADERPSAWTASDVPDMAGRVAVVTGANSGIGFETARVLAQCGARVVLACRSVARGRLAAEQMTDSPAGAPEVVELDLGSLASVSRAAERIRDSHPRVDLLINNAGVMDVPDGTTEDGFERHLGINHLGHFALTGLLLPQSVAVPGSRVVVVGSLVHTRGRIDFDDLAFARDYKPSRGYARSKLANLLFAFELQRRLAAAGAQTVALAAHPGVSATALDRYEPVWVRLLTGLLKPVVFQSAAMGALPTLRAATDPAAAGGAYYGPDGRRGFKGHPVLVSAADAAHDPQVARQLWEESERLTGVSFLE